MSHECHESEYSKFLKSLGIDKEKMLADMESRLSEDERNRLRKMRLERIEELEAQIEKMKCCENCDNWNWKHSKCEKKLKGDCFKASKWILRR